jgi:hypothetical protein
LEKNGWFRGLDKILGGRAFSGFYEVEGSKDGTWAQSRVGMFHALASSKALIWELERVPSLPAKSTLLVLAAVEGRVEVDEVYELVP